MRKHVSTGLLAVVLVIVSACTAETNRPDTPELAPRGETTTTVKPARQDLFNTFSLTGKVTIQPVFGVLAPSGGEVRYVELKPGKAAGTNPAKPLKVAAIWKKQKNQEVTIPVGSSFASRLMEDRATVSQGMPIIAAKLDGYGIVADIDGSQAYRISDAPPVIKAQIKDGPGPFACTAVGAIAALPAGTVPTPPEPKTPPEAATGGDPATAATAAPVKPTAGPGPSSQVGEPSEPTGLRVVCSPPADVKLINGVEVTLEVVTGTVTQALVVPVEAVAGLQGKGKVDVVNSDKTRETKDVVLGLTDGKVVEIKAGLTGNEELAVPGPDLPAAEAPRDGAGQ